MNNEFYKANAWRHIYRYNSRSRIKYWFAGLLVFILLALFLPWTQTIRSRGNVTTLRQEQRPQQMNTVIPGKVIKWFVKEGDFVRAGDTILQIAEIKDDYLDPDLVSRTGEQLEAKKQSLGYYASKASAAALQIEALSRERDLKLEQVRNKTEQQHRKIQSDEQDLQAAIKEKQVAARQLNAGKILLDAGVIALVDYEKRNVQYQQSQAKATGTENKLANSKQELTILTIEQNAIGQEYAEKISKVTADRFQALSEIASSRGEIAKLQNQYSNYRIRKDMYYITAPQDGQVTKAKKAGIGEIVREGEMIVEIVPAVVQHTVEIFVRPVDLPLISPGQKISLWFDGFPAIVFSGWPHASYGTFEGRVIAVENAVSPNGKFRVLVAEEPAGQPWPAELRVGTGAEAIALLKNVPVWYELWRNINGFPPDYYRVNEKIVLQ